MKKKFLISFGLFFSLSLSGCFSPVIVDVVETKETVEVVETVDTQEEKVSIEHIEPIAQAQYTKYIPAKILDKSISEKSPAPDWDIKLVDFLAPSNASTL